jgi:threonine dehydratase
MTNTPLIKLDNIYLKREDKNITGSAKDRALPLQIDNLLKSGFSKAVISSTGNAAISAAYFCQQKHIELTIFLSLKVSPQKLSLLKQFTSEIILSPKPISDAIKFSKLNNSFLLRQSTDPVSLLGYQQISQEIITQLPQITSIFVPVGSGTTLIGLSQKLPSHIPIFGCQSATNCPVGKLFDTDFVPENRLITDALSVKFLPQKNILIDTIKKTNGFIFVVQNNAIIQSSHYLETKNIITSLEGALCFASYQKAVKNNYPVGDFPVILLTGAKR